MKTHGTVEGGGSTSAELLPVLSATGQAVLDYVNEARNFGLTFDDALAWLRTIPLWEANDDLFLPRRPSEGTWVESLMSAQRHTEKLKQIAECRMRQSRGRQPELTDAGAVHRWVRTQAFRRGLRGGVFHRGEHLVQAIEPFFSCNKTVELVDPYALRANNREGILRFLKLCLSAAVTKVVVRTCLRKGGGPKYDALWQQVDRFRQDLDEVVAAVDDHRELELSLRLVLDGSQSSHDRYLVFMVEGEETDNAQVLSLGYGVAGLVADGGTVTVSRVIPNRLPQIRAPYLISDASDVIELNATIGAISGAESGAESGANVRIDEQDPWEQSFHDWLAPHMAKELKTFWERIRSGQQRWKNRGPRRLREICNPIIRSSDRSAKRQTLQILRDSPQPETRETVKELIARLEDSPLVRAR